MPDTWRRLLVGSIRRVRSRLLPLIRQTRRTAVRAGAAIVRAVDGETPPPPRVTSAAPERSATCQLSRSATCQLSAPLDVPSGRAGRVRAGGARDAPTGHAQSGHVAGTSAQSGHVAGTSARGHVAGTTPPQSSIGVMRLGCASRSRRDRDHAEIEIMRRDRDHAEIEITRRDRDHAEIGCASRVGVTGHCASHQVSSLIMHQRAVIEPVHNARHVLASQVARTA